MIKRFPIEERFSFGITDPGLNDPDAYGYNPDLAPYDLTRGGTLFDFHAKRTGSYGAAYIQDNFHYQGLTANLGVRYDHNDLPKSEQQLQPRIGLAYYLTSTRTVLRASYNRVFLTPEYENILFGSSPEAAALVPPAVKESRELGRGVLLNLSERQNAYMVGLQQAVGSKLRVDVDFWWRRSKNPADQDQFENTGIVFPITFTEGRHNGWDVRLDLAETHGVRGFVSVGHTRALYVPPPVGGLFLDVGAIDAITGGPFLIDHDQKLQAQGQLVRRDPHRRRPRPEPHQGPHHRQLLAGPRPASSSRADIDPGRPPQRLRHRGRLQHPLGLWRDPRDTAAHAVGAAALWLRWQAELVRLADRRGRPPPPSAAGKRSLEALSRGRTSSPVDATPGGERPSFGGGGGGRLRAVQDLADLAEQGVRREGFLQEGRPRLDHAVVAEGLVRVARHVEDGGDLPLGLEP